MSIFFKYRNRKYYSNLKIYSGNLFLYEKENTFFYLEFEKFCIEITLLQFNLTKENIFQISLRDKTKILDDYFIGPYFKRIINLECKQSLLLIELQNTINFGYKRFIKLKAFN